MAQLLFRTTKLCVPVPMSKCVARFMNMTSSSRRVICDSKHTSIRASLNKGISDDVVRHASLLSFFAGGTLGGRPNDITFTKVVSDAEKLVGYPTSFMSLRCLLSDEMSNVAMYVRKLVGTKHPLLKTARGLVLEGKHAVQTRGLIVLLISKAAGPTTKTDQPAMNDELISGIHNSQRQLAEIVELIHTANLIHLGVVNLKDVQPTDGPLKDMELGNKVAILSGDFLLANACTALAQLRNTKVVEIISSAIGNMMEAEFVHIDDSNLPLPAPFSIDQWEEHCYLSRGALIAKSCRSAMELAGHSEERQEKASEFGKHMACTQKLHEELQPYLNPDSEVELSLTSAPTIMYLQNNKDIKPNELLDEKRLYRAIFGSSSTINKVQNLCKDHGEKAIDALQIFHPSDARTALEKIIQALMTFPIR
ncbi:all trans-polyprenyl-diphosphate synthase PDSS2-like [Lineus longissimus]|uniref:all trans-polyprenyl-diphosphate synthase PDSS2-like n=1 Tax=Lineus longissimus TaxID=88925 RepID=UPI002B4C8321